MSILMEEDARPDTLRSVAGRMAAAARTAPKAKGVDHLAIAILDADSIAALADRMEAMVAAGEAPSFFTRDAGNLRVSGALVLVGTRIRSLGLQQCGLCGFADCAAREQAPRHPCAFNTGDLGIAVGSAVSVAADARVDSRVMYSAGKAAVAMGLLGDDVRIAYAIPISCTGKSPYFDRK